MSDNYSEKDIYSNISQRILEVCNDNELKPSYLIQNNVAAHQTVYNVLNGKQKPGIDFAVKFLILFPDVNGDWLLTGKGEKYQLKNSGLKAIYERNTYLEQNSNDVSGSMNIDYYKEMMFEKDNRINDLKEQVEALKGQNSALSNQNAALIDQNKTILNVLKSFSEK